ncbi:hypothetical protein QBC35DRAFT_532845 [Podospora australis]|uniref:Uncharacterized protein n=1 Tax=Podospora australis TaxID=1536484 RepID=A0AAN6WRW4_9PEZI|nr:hypothetical protein QBC35DRAFT_532845 [Podospora australis]
MNAWKEMNGGGRLEERLKRASNKDSRSKTTMNFGLAVSSPMEGLRNQALKAFSNSNFSPRENEHEIITVREVGATLERRSAPLHTILENEERRPSSSCLPALRLVKLQIDDLPPDNLALPPTLNATKEDIRRLWKLFNLNPVTLHHISEGMRGLHVKHQFPPTWNPSSGRACQLMASSYTYCAVWTYNPQTQTTDAVIISRSRYPDRLEKFLDALQNQTGIVEHPLCLLMALVMEAVGHASVNGVDCQGQILKIEKVTGFNPWLCSSEPPVSSSQDMPMTLSQATQAFRTMGTVLVLLEDHQLHISSLWSLIGSLKEAGLFNESCGGGDLMVSADLAVGLHAIEQQMAHWENRITYLKERGRNQLHVVNTVLNRLDAASSIQIAESARKESSSMKTIAIMTMSFLPGTFLAAYFALWQSDPAVQFNHWLFWVCSIVSTAVVFLCYNFQPWQRLMRGKTRRNTHSKEQIGKTPAELGVSPWHVEPTKDEWWSTTSFKYGMMGTKRRVQTQVSEIGGV